MDCIAIQPQCLATRRRRAGRRHTGRAGRAGGGEQAEVRRGPGALGAGRACRWALGELARWALRHGRGASCDTAEGPAATRRWSATIRLHTRGHVCGLGTLGRAAGPAGCALGAPSLFFDSVLFLSHRLDTVREHCS